MPRVSASPEAFGPYLVYEELGAGGMAKVHRAEQTGLAGFRKVVALKRMLPHVAANQDMVKAFVREARLASYLRHTNVAQTYELGKVGDIYFIAMELIEGRSLSQVLRACSAAGTKIPVPIALNIINQICDALDYAHNLCDDQGQPLGIIHRDVSPSNVILAEGGVVKLIDFGIAKASAAGMQTMSGAIKGKFGYMAPEYLEGSIDARADLFAVGVIAHELLVNRPLFTARDDIETLHRVRGMAIVPPSRGNPGVPPEIDEIVMTALERDPDRRWQHATALRNAMTTLTKRLGLDVMDQQVSEWLDRTLLEMPTKPIYIGAPPPQDDGASISISRDDLPPGLPTTPTVSLKAGFPEPPTVAPAGTPARSVTALSIPPTRSSLPPSDLTPGSEYAAAVQHYDRHAALIPSGSFLADEVVPTVVRSSAPRIVAGPPEGAIDAPPSPPPQVPVPAARPSAPRIATSAERSSVQRLAPPRPDSTPGPAEPRNRTNPVLAVLLVLLAAAVAATTVYFVLPLVT